MNIAHIESSIDWGGQELRIIEQTEWLNAHGYPAWLIARPQSAILKQAQARHLPCFALPIRGAFNPRVLSRLLSFLYKHKIDVLDCHSNRDSHYGAYVKWLTQTKVIRSRHVTDPIKTKGLHRFIWRYGQQGVVVTANAIRDQLLTQKLVTADHIFVAPAGADPHRFHPNIQNQALRQALGIPTQHKIIANIGMIRPDKGQLYFVQACSQLLAQRNNISCIQVGEATQQTQAYKQQVLTNCGHDLNNGIYFLGYQSAIENYLALADIVVIASISTEAQTRLVAQAFLMKKNIIATTTGGLPEMITDQQTGLLCPPKNISALTQAINQLLSQPEYAQKLANNAFQYAQQYMTFDYMMEKMLAFYQRDK